MGEYRDKKSPRVGCSESSKHAAAGQVTGKSFLQSAPGRSSFWKITRSCRKITQMEKRQAELEREFNRIQRGRIKVFDVVYPGVHITIGRAIYVVNDPIKYAMFILEDGEVKLTSLS